MQFAISKPFKYHFQLLKHSIGGRGGGKEKGEVLVHGELWGLMGAWGGGAKHVEWESMGSGKERKKPYRQKKKIPSVSSDVFAKNPGYKEI